MKYSLMIGRFQPWHEGHSAMVEKIINEGKNVCIAVRDTPMNDQNPYGLSVRIGEIHKLYLSEVACGRIKVIRLPDIEEVVYGREVGWGIREIRLDKEIEAISSTKIRSDLANGSERSGKDRAC